MLKLVLGSPSLCEQVLVPAPCQSGPQPPSLTSVIKRLLLTKQDLLQIAAAQCLITAVSHPRGQHYVDLMLASDMAGRLCST